MDPETVEKLEGLGPLEEALSIALYASLQQDI